MKIGDRVYHTGAPGNGVIAAIDLERGCTPYGVRFWWLKYKKKFKFHNLNGAIDDEHGLWCSGKRLISTPHPYSDGAEHHNIVSMIGGRSMERLFRLICELPKREANDDSEIVINYGISNHRVSTRVRCINRHLVPNKFIQCCLMSDAGVSVPEVTMYRDQITSDSEWIAKPFNSAYGRNINYLEHYRDWNTGLQYAQRHINKVREFRAHVFTWAEDKVPSIQEKIVDDKTQLCWNEHQGARFTKFHTPLYNQIGEEPLTSRMKDVALRACIALGYDFGGVDIALDDNNDLWVFEINSRMGVKERSLAVYKTAFWELYNI
jgi:hypothetical protein